MILGVRHSKDDFSAVRLAAEKSSTADPRLICSVEYLTCLNFLQLHCHFGAFDDIKSKGLVEGGTAETLKRDFFRAK